MTRIVRGSERGASEEDGEECEGHGENDFICAAKVDALLEE